MKKYNIELTKKAEKQLNKLGHFEKGLILNWIYKNLYQCVDPRVHGKALKGNLKQYWRYRVGNYRILAEINDNKLIIHVISVGHRKEIYK